MNSCPGIRSWSAIGFDPRCLWRIATARSSFLTMPGVGDGNAKDVAGREVIQDASLALAPRRALGHPRFGPDDLGDPQIWAALLERGPELPAHEFGEGLHREKEPLRRRMPLLSVVGDRPPPVTRQCTGGTSG